MNFAIYEQATGQVILHGSAPDDYEPILEPTQALFLGLADDSVYIDAAGAAIPKGPRPSAKHVFDYGRKAWVDPRTIAQLRDEQWNQVKAARDAAEYGGFSWDGSVFDSDPVSQSRIQGASQLASLALMHEQAFSIDWTLADNTVRTLDEIQMLAVGQAMGVHIATQHGKGRRLREQIETADSAEAIAAIGWV